MNKKKFLPSKKFLKALLGIVILIAIVLLIGAVSNKKTLFKQNNQGKVVVVSDVVEKDTDGDGLKDWEESLWGTDPKNPDTDGNGVQDGEQIHKIQAILEERNQNSLDSIQNDKTKTGALTRDILTIASAVTQSGQLTPESQSAITDEIAKSLAQRNQTTYSLSDITLLDKATKNQILAYVYKIKKSVEGTTVTQNDVTLISDYEENMTSNNMGPYLQTAEKFRKERDLILKTPVPEQYIDIHLQYINSLEGLRLLYIDMGQQEEDPAKALAAYSSAQTVFDTYQNVLELMQK